MRADSGEQLWSESYDRGLKDVFRVQDEIAEAVVSTLKLKVPRSSRSRAHVAPEAWRPTTSSCSDGNS